MSEPTRLTYCMNCMEPLESENQTCPVCGYSIAQTGNTAEQLPFTVLAGKYLVGRALGQGGFGITYIGLELNLHIKVAIKEYYPQGYATRSTSGDHSVVPGTGCNGEFFLMGKEKFISEAQILARLESFSSIVHVRDYFLEHGTAYIVMDYVEGKTLEKYAKERGGRLDYKEAVTLLSPLMRQLDVVHAKKIIHRDISPDNIIIREDGRAVLLDFGAARNYISADPKSGSDSNGHYTVNVKRGYAPVEQYSATSTQGSFTDVYAMAATLYTTLCGQRPPQSFEILNGDSPLTPPTQLNPKLTGKQEAVLLKGLATRPQDRWQTMGEFNSALCNAMESKASQGSKGRGNLTPKLIGLSAAAAAVVGVALFALNGGSKPQTVLPDDMPTIIEAPQTNAVQTANTNTAAPAATSGPTVEMEGTTAEGWIYKGYSDGTSTITGWMGEDVNVVIPEKLGKYRVTRIGNQAFNVCTSLTSITIPDSVTSIGNHAFNACKSLTSITIPQGVTSIGDYAFLMCEGLESVTIPDSVTTLGDGAFAYCGQLTKLDISPNHAALEIIDGVLFSKADHRLIWYPCAAKAQKYTIPEGTESIGDAAFYYCGNLIGVTISNGVTSIGDGAFFSCSKLERVAIPNSVTSIGKSAFSYCAKLTRVTIPESVTSIGETAFYSCQNLMSINIPDSVTTLGDGAFAQCPQFALLDISPYHPALELAEGVLFGKEDHRLIWYPCTAERTAYTIPDGTEILGGRAFLACDNLTSITLPDSVTRIGNFAFSGCGSLTSITIPDSVTHIGIHALDSCPSLTDVSVSKGSYAEQWARENGYESRLEISN